MTFDKVLVKRREILATAGAVVATPVVASGDVRADDHGYGAGVYGDGTYGDPPDGGAGEDEEPEKETSLTVETHEATDVDGSAATLRGELTELQGYEEATIRFEWGQNGELLNSTDAGTVSSTGEFGGDVADLESGAQYEYRAVADASDDTATGETLSFTTQRREEVTDAHPQILRFDAEDTSNPRNPHADVSVKWEASIDDGELGSAELTVSDSAGLVLFWGFELCEKSVERSAQRRIHHGGGETYTVELTVYTNHGTSETAQTTFDSP